MSERNAQKLLDPISLFTNEDGAIDNSCRSGCTRLRQTSNDDCLQDQASEQREEDTNPQTVEFVDLDSCGMSQRPLTNLGYASLKVGCQERIWTWLFYYFSSMEEGDPSATNQFIRMYFPSYKPS